MTEIIQQPDYIIGDQKSINELALKENARILLVSDVHGNTNTLEKIILQYGCNCDALILTGDSGGDLAEILNRWNYDQKIKAALPKVIFAVRGNCDPTNIPVPFVSKSFHLPEKLIATVNNKRIMIVHGHVQNIAWGLERLGLEMQYSDAVISVYGHSHIAKESYIDKYRFINPGSCTNPRGGQPKCFAIITVGNNFVDTAFIKINRTEPFEGTVFQPIY